MASPLPSGMREGSANASDIRFTKPRPRDDFSNAHRPVSTHKSSTPDPYRFGPQHQHPDGLGGASLYSTTESFGKAKNRSLKSLASEPSEIRASSADRVAGWTGESEADLAALLQNTQGGQQQPGAAQPQARPGEAEAEAAATEARRAAAAAAAEHRAELARRKEYTKANA